MAAPKLDRFSQRLDLVIEQGATFDPIITWQDDTGTPIDLTGYKARMQIRAQLEDPTPVPGGDLTTEKGATEEHIVLGGTAGTIQPVIPASVTAAYTFESAVYDLELVVPGTPDKVTRLLYGNVTLVPEVTR